MQRPKSIVVGLDFETDGPPGLTRGSLDAAQRGLWLGGLCAARVDFLHATARGAEDPEPTSAETIAAGRRQLEDLRAGFELESTELEIDDERPSRALVLRVLSGRNDLVVVAKRNHGRTEDRWLGSVSRELLRTCPCPVWAVKPGQPAEHRAVLAATDLTPVGDRATAFGALIAEAEPCALHVVHAWQLPLDLQLSHARLGDAEFKRQTCELEDAARRHITSLAALRDLPAGVSVHLHVARDTPSHLIQQAAHSLRPDLAVLGTVSRGGIAGMLLGNTAEKLVYTLDCSLLTLKPVDFVCPVRA